MCEIGESAVSIELSAVNHRNMDASLRLPHEWSPLDPVLRDVLKQRIARGKVNLSITRKRNGGSAQRLKFAPEVAQEYIEAAKELSRMLHSHEALSPGVLAQFPGVFFYEEAEPEDLETAKDALLAGLGEALDHLDAMRTTEGAALTKDLHARLDLIRKSVAIVEERLPELNRAHEEKLRTRIREFAEDAGINEDRVSLEVAIMAERGDVTEEVVRLKSHMDHAEELLAADEPAGRKLNFLTQEIQREINTLGSKVRDTDVTRQVLEMKSELEKIREQVQNIE